MTIRCKYCGSEDTLTERETSQIAADLDEQYTLEEQTQLVFSCVCSDCWLREEAELLAAARSAGKRVLFVTSHP